MALEKGHCGGQRLIGSFCSTDDFQKLHTVSGIEEVRADHPAGVFKNGSHFGNGQCRGVGGKNDIIATNLLQFLPDLLLNLHIFQYGLDDQIDILHVFQSRGCMQLSAQFVLQVRRSHFLLFNEIVKGFADRGKRFFKSLIVDFP